MPIADNLFEITPDTWIISDTHFFHENIGGYCRRPENWQELIITPTVRRANTGVRKFEAVLKADPFKAKTGVRFHRELPWEVL